MLDERFVTAYFLAVRAHDERVDKAGEPYIFHSLRVSDAFSSFSNEKVIAVLHDVIEDSNTTLKDIAEGLQLNPTADKDAAIILLSIDALTRQNGESYTKYIDRLIAHKRPEILAVKLKDLEDNMNLKRLKKVTATDLRRLEKYQKAHHKISEAMKLIDLQALEHLL